MTFYDWCIENNKQEMLEEWDSVQNIDTPRTITYGSTKAIYWKCARGHSWFVSPNKRTAKGGSGCPYCLNKKVLAGFNDLLTLRPDIASEWDYERNDISPTDITVHSNVYAFWKCSREHYYKAKVNDRTKEKGTGCPYCANQKVWSGYNDLLTLYPELAKEYHKKNKISSNSIYGRSTQKVWWLCPNGHEYDACISDRVAGNGCPYCAGRRVLFGYNDLKTLFPEIAAEWDYEKNAEEKVTPENVIAGSTKEVWWKCKEGHSWKRKIEVRTHLGTGCPYCAGQRAIEGENDIASKFPELAKEWDYKLNGDRTPNNTMPGAGCDIHWICSRGHRYVTSPNNRTSANQGCPICAKERHTSFPEQAIYYYLSNFYSVVNRYVVKGYELDVFIPEINMAIEYDGIFYHHGEASDERERRKEAFCSDAGIDLFRIKETNEKKKDEEMVFYRLVPEKGARLNEIIVKLLDIAASKFGKSNNTNVDVNRDRQKIWSQYIFAEKSNSLQALHPQIANEWDYELNEGLQPDQVSIGSHKRVHWICEKGHRYEIDIKHRVSGTGCPYCANKKVLAGYNDLATIFPQLAEQWDYTTNGDEKPTEFTAYSNKKVFWLCSKGHSYIASIAKRSNGRGCPYCANKKVLKGYNDITTTNPEVLIDWDYSKNTIEPTALTAGSQKEVYWKCHVCGNEYKATPYMRVYRGFGCKKCKNDNNHS